MRRFARLGRFCDAGHSPAVMPITECAISRRPIFETGMTGTPYRCLVCQSCSQRRAPAFRRRHLDGRRPCAFVAWPTVEIDDDDALCCSRRGPVADNSGPVPVRTSEPSARRAATGSGSPASACPQPGTRSPVAPGILPSEPGSRGAARGAASGERANIVSPAARCTAAVSERLHPSLMLASRTTRLHFSISAATKARKSSGVFSRNSTLSEVRRSITSRWRSTALRPALSLAMIGAGVPVGTSTPFHS